MLDNGRKVTKSGNTACYHRSSNCCQFFFQSEQLLNPCIISVVEKPDIETPTKNDVTKGKDVTVDEMDVDVVEEAEKADDVGLEIVKSILDDVVLDVTRPPLEEFIGSIISDMVSSFTVGFKIQTSLSLNGSDFRTSSQQV